MMKRIEFKNFKVLRDTTLPLGQFTLIVGPNGSGKSTALQGLQMLPEPGKAGYDTVGTIGGSGDVTVTAFWEPPDPAHQTVATWFEQSQRGVRLQHFDRSGQVLSSGNNTVSERVRQQLLRNRVYNLNPDEIAQPVVLAPNIELVVNGSTLAGVLDRLRDNEPERFEALNAELSRWLPEFDRILFETPRQGQRAVALRTNSRHAIRAADLSHGTLLALAILTIAYLPDPPPLVAFEDPDRGLHPRLLRDVRDALYRLAYPESYGEQREPVQVIATTHSPYFLDLFKEHPEEIVIAQKKNGEAVFENLSDRPDIDEILADASLGDVWYSGILGGVPVAP